MTTGLQIAKNLVLPLDAVTQTFGFIARKGGGKTYAAGKLVEELLGHGVPVIILDPVGNWWGLRLGADGKSPGFKIPVFGGLHGDLPLSPDIGGTVARLIIEKHLPAVLDVSSFRKNERKKFVTAFAEELFHRAKIARSPTLVVFEEAQVFAPQQAKGEEQMLGAVEDIVRLGRNYGLGSVLISQRPQSVNKEVLNQVECLFVGQLNAEHERKAIEKWIVEKGADLDYAKELPSLPQGHMFLWSPQWLGKFQKIQIAKKKTFDASATPKLGEKQTARELAEVDLVALQEAFKDAVKSAKEDDPKLLRARIAELEAKKPSALSKTDYARLANIADKIKAWNDGFAEIQTRMSEAAGKLLALHQAAMAAIQTTFQNVQLPHDNGTLNREEWAALEKMIENPVPAPKWIREAVHAPKKDAREAIVEAENQKAFKAIDMEGIDLPKVERMMLRAIVQHDPRPLSLAQVAIFAGYSAKTSGVKNGLGALRSKGLIIGGNDAMRSTSAGKKLIGKCDPLPTGPALAAEWYRKLGKANRTMLQVIVKAYPKHVDMERVAETAGYSVKTSSVKNGLGKLRSLHLIHGGNSAMVADETLIR